jgi:hypothetical protein
MELRRMIRIHLAEEASGGREPSHDQTAIKAFALLRDLRAMGRRLGNDAGSWKEWPPSIRKLALTETAPIAKFLAELKVVAHEPPIAGAPSTTSPGQSPATSFSGLPQVSAAGGRRTLRPPQGGLRSGNPRHSSAHAPQTGHPRIAGAATIASNSAIL